MRYFQETHSETLHTPSISQKRRFALEEIRAAHERLERKEQFGKIVLAP